MRALYSLSAVLIVAGLAFLGGATASLRPTFGVMVPYAALCIFLLGFSYKVMRWAQSPVPFRIPTTCGQQKSLPWIKAAWIESPSTRLGVLVRMTLEILLFRSLFRNTRAGLRKGPKLVYTESKFLWLGALAFHWSFLVILLRHLRFFMEPIPGFVYRLERLDSFFQIGAPVLYITDVLVVSALFYLLFRRIGESQVRCISLFTDYFALLLLLGLAISGILMRYFTRVEIAGIKEFAIGLATFSPVIPAGASPLFFVHVTLLSVFAAYFPFSKLMHSGGIFLSPTRNLANDSRMKRHVNVWDYPVKVHTYEEWEDEFRDKMKAAGLPVERP
jgi:nitrate reductase gamma subunit